MAAESVPSPDTSPQTAPLRAILEVEPAPSANCVLASETPDAAAVTQSLSETSTCHGEATVRDGDGEYRPVYVSRKVNSSCVCTTLRRFDCVFDIEEVRAGSLVFSLVVEDRSLLTDIVTTLKSTGATVSLRRISPLGTDADDVLEVDASAITAKQREAVELAVEMGYYDRPRRATLDDLAERLEVSKSAVSQRLTAVEETLVRSLTV
ncbi:helix-turn-helix domain-containing protein [Natrialbaceae archaeon GCM10025810]|uniref:helix-turn-helix domain-containing protein n=1 Tax=Halovalidus salilacus TaxID=3075124 RepID=UPI00361895B5